MNQYPQNAFETKLVMMGAELLPHLGRPILEALGGPEGTKQELVGEKDMGNYVIRTEKITSPNMPSFEIESAYAGGLYIGDPKTAKMLDERGIKPELASPDHNVCSIGFCEKDQKWFGWSHRAICEFKVGHIVTEDSILRSNGWIEGCDQYIKEQDEIDSFFRTGVVAVDSTDCRRFAERFAEAVG